MHEYVIFKLFVNGDQNSHEYSRLIRNRVFILLAIFPCAKLIVIISLGERTHGRYLFIISDDDRNDGNEATTLKVGTYWFYLSVYSRPHLPAFLMKRSHLHTYIN